MSQLLGKAVLQYLNRGTDSSIITLNSLGEEEEVPVSYFFRSYDEMPQLEQAALDLAKGTILDIGAGAGSHSLILQSRGLDVTALDLSEDAVQCCRERGILKSVCGRVQDHQGGPYDTMLLFMNGIGVAGYLSGLDELLKKLQSMMSQNGQILLDSSDIRYMYNKEEWSKHTTDESGSYYGDILFSVYYDGGFEPPFPWVYVDYENLQQAASRCGLKAEKIMDGPHFDYLARLTRD